MRRERIEADQALFTERLAGRAVGARRSLARARALAPHLGIDLADWSRRPERVLIVVGSKGKGTAATFASAVLATSGLRVGTLTSPGLLSNRERIRVDGRAITRQQYEPLVAFVAETVTRVGPALPGDGYLSPGGLFTLAALRHFDEQGCDAVVLEAGMGGASDEVSLVVPAVVAITAILAEHLGVLGSSVAEIATEKAGVTRDGTLEVVTAVQGFPEAEEAIIAAAREHGCRVHTVEAGNPEGAVATAGMIAWGGSEPPAPQAPGAPLPPGLAAVSAAVGVIAALRLLGLRGLPAPGPAVLDTALRGVQLPGRLSHHRRGLQRWIVDCATNPAAITTALEHAISSIGPPTAVLTFIPRHRDAAPLLDALGGQPVVRVPGGRAGPTPGEGAVMRLDAVDLDGLGPRVLAVGPVYFAGEVLATLGIDGERSF